MLGKTDDSASCDHGGLDGRPVSSRGRQWISQRGIHKPLAKQRVAVGALVFPGTPVPWRSEQDISGQITPNPVTMLGKSNDSATPIPASGAI